MGSGFGGSVAALRLTEKGYRVAVIEAGRRFADDEFARTSWDLKRYLWAPQLGCYGIQRIHMLKDVMVLAGVDVGGGSSVCANRLYRPLKPFYNDRQWSHITDWESELAPHYDQASRMLGVVTNPTITPSDEVMRDVAKDIGVAESFHPTPVGVYFGKPGKNAKDPFFGGAGPERTGCTECGACMTGCRVGAKNTLVKNYIYLAEQAGAQVIPLTTVTAVRPKVDGFEVDLRRTGKRTKSTLTAGQVVLAAGTWGTQNLLHKMKDIGALPKLSRRLGELTRTNSEAIIGAARTQVDENRNFSKGSNAMSLLQTIATDCAAKKPRWRQAVDFMVKHPVQTVKLLNGYRWSERTVILLVMQSLDNSITTYTKRGLFGRRKYTSKQGHGEPNPSFIPAGHEANVLTAQRIGGMPGGTWGEIFDIPLTTHFIGGASIGADASSGVIDPYHRVFGYPGLSVVDGSAITANLGANPSLTITAQAEQAFSFWPNKGETNARPAQDESYTRLSAIAPKNPAAPSDAPAALR